MAGPRPAASSRLAEGLLEGRLLAGLRRPLERSESVDPLRLERVELLALRQLVEPVEHLIDLELQIRMP
jgi:hypothetical protein